MVNKNLMITRNKKHKYQFCLKLSGITLLFILASCSWIYPDYNKPQFNLNQKWSVSSDKLNNVDLSKDLWWQEFKDVELNYLVESALYNNNSIKIALANIDAAKGQLKAINLSFLPTITPYVGYSTNPSLGVPGGYYGIWPGYFSLNIFSTLAREKSASIKLKAYEYALQSTRIVLIAGVVNSYIALLAQQQQQRLLDKLIDDLTLELKIADASFKNGITSEYEYENILVELKNTKAEQDVIAANIIKSQNALCYLLNQPPHAMKTKGDFKLLEVSSTNPNIFPATVLNNRPDVHFMEEKYKLAVQNTAIPYTSLLPNITLDQFVGGFNAFTNSNPYGSNASITDSYVSSTLNPSIFGQIDQLGAEKQAAFYAYIDTVNKVLKDVDDSLVDFNAAVKSFKNISASDKASREKYELKENLYKTGNISKLELLMESTLLDKADLELNFAKLNHTYTLVKLYEELGGGYKTQKSP